MMTWGEFKQQVELGGVKDDDEVIRVDYDPNDTFSAMETRRDSNGQWIICNEDY